MDDIWTWFLMVFTINPSPGSSSMASGKIGVNGVDLYYEKVGSGPTAILLMPGALGSTKTDFQPQLEKLNRDRFTIVAFDPRGYGKSRPPERDFPADFFHRDAKDARDLMKALGFSKFCPLGWSDGGITAQILAGTYPADVYKLVIWGSNAYFTEQDVELFEATRDISKWSERMRAPMVAVYGEENFAKLWSAWCDRMKQFLNNPGGDICIEETKSISCPTLIFHGDLDPMVMPEHPLFLSSAIKGSRLIRWPKGKHNIHLRFADDFNQEVENFLMAEESKL
ncbi:valacyclovir hydrolase-like [Diadema antillarum]|uniref:valacyclovir hydrolase-like n=1 Tax=Diadema antillarum TaxID=105358 RepID=UPI003A83F99F